MRVRLEARDWSQLERFLRMEELKLNVEHEPGRWGDATFITLPTSTAEMLAVLHDLGQVVIIAPGEDPREATADPNVKLSTDRVNWVLYVEHRED